MTESFIREVTVCFQLLANVLYTVQYMRQVSLKTCTAFPTTEMLFRTTQTTWNWGRYMNR